MHNYINKVVEILKKLLMGNEAIAFGAIRAGVSVVCGYPGTPSTEALETVAKHNDGSIYVEWSVNEKSAMELGAGAAYAGARVMVTMKQVGLNVASDPLMSLAYIGVKGGMVILVADDPGPNSSQTEQDTRHFAKFANLPVLDPSTPEEAYEMTQYAFELSEQTGLPVFLRPTTRVCHACATIDIDLSNKHECKPQGFVKDSRWVIFPVLAYRRHIELEEQQDKISAEFDNCAFNSVTGSGELGVAASGVAYAYVCDVIKKHSLDIKLFKAGTPYPFPIKTATKFLEGLKRAIVIEELDPVVETALFETAARSGFLIKISGKIDNSVPKCGELSYELVERLLLTFCGKELPVTTAAYSGSLPARIPTLCAGCPHRASFYAVKQAMRSPEFKDVKSVFTGDIGCYTLGNAKPLDMTDTCLCMGASVTVAQGIKRVEPDVKVFAFIGDSTFFHTGIPGVVNALYNDADITVVILDNSTTAMTGHQPHPGIGKTMMGSMSAKISIYDTLKGLGVKSIQRINPFDQKAAIKAAKEAAKQKGVSVIIFEAPCIALFKKEQVYSVNKDKCKACGKCINEIGCPAIFRAEDKKAAVDSSLCYGCGLCAELCSFGALEVTEI